MEKNTFIVFGEWEDDLDDLTNDEIAGLTRAFFAYVKRGEKPAFRDRMVRSCWRKIQQAEDRVNDAYAAKCEKNRENGKKGGAPKGNQNATKQQNNPNNRTVKKTTETTLPEPDSEPDSEPEPGRGRGGDSEREAAAPQNTTTTTDLKDAIVEIWNSHDFVQKIRRVDSPQKRWERTEMAIAVAGGKKEFLHQLQTLDEHAYLKNQPDQGYKVIYDWLTDPENFQSFLEGRYKDARGDAKKYEGWEVVEFG